MADGTERLCQAVYGRPSKARDYIGGSEARMLHDAADLIARLRAVAEAARAYLSVPVTAQSRPPDTPEFEAAVREDVRAWDEADRRLRESVAAWERGGAG